MQPQFSEPYTFYTTADDGVRFYLNGQLLIDGWVDQTSTTHSVTIPLAGQQLYTIEMDYYQRNSNAVVKLAWSSPSTSQSVIPHSQLYPFTNPPPSVVLTAPANSSSYTAFGSVTLSADADAPYNPIARVNFYVGGLLAAARYESTLHGHGDRHWPSAAYQLDRRSHRWKRFEQHLRAGKYHRRPRHGTTLWARRVTAPFRRS